MKEELIKTVETLCKNIQLNSNRGTLDNIDPLVKAVAAMTGCFCSIREQEIHEEFHLNMEAQMKDYIPGEDLLGKN